MFNRTLTQELATRSIFNGTTGTSAIDGTFVDMTDYHRCRFLVQAPATVAANIVITAREATSSAGANGQDISTALNGTIVATTDNGRVALIEVLDTDLTVGYPFISLRFTTSSNQTVIAVADLADPVSLPVTNGTANGVAYVKRVAG